ncbi:MAG: DUF5916 domain-containing protein [Chitinophagaceae bacterium]
MRWICLSICILFCLHGLCQNERKKCTAIRISIPIKIDGNLNEEAWKNAPIFTNFIENKPVSGRPQRAELKTEVKVLYDNTALYIGAFMHDVSSDSIRTEIAQRDAVGNADFFMVFIDTYNTGINGYGFMVTTANSQYDARYSNDNNGEDASWNAVWESATKIVGHNWMAEIKIPYSALRFAKKDVQTWGINFLRRRIATQQDFFWNFIDPIKAGFVNQWGELNGINNIKPPLRLSFTPYFSTYLNHYPYNTPDIKNTSVLVNGGMDVKYGINESFTLDMTLIPDFGQVQSDNQILNLTPFEVKYNENRSFFTEGTELFNKGNLFYSRRVGGTPILHDSVQYNLPAGETVISNPTESRLINATKISGRTKSGLGIGFFNALTQSSYAIAQDSSGNKLNIKTQPLTNYNIIVLDQSLKNNSSVTFINTNVSRASMAYNADVSSGLFNLFTKNNAYNLNGQLAVSQLYGANQKDVAGYYYLVSGGKSSGKFNAILTHSVMDDKYNPNDLGILFNNNEIDDILNLNYSIVKPGSWYTSLFMGSSATYSQRFVPRMYQNLTTNFYISPNLKNLWRLNLNVNWNPFTANDFYEARTTGRIYKSPANYSVELNGNTNRAKKYTVYFDFAYREHYPFGGTGIDATYDHSYRFSDKFSMEQSISLMPRMNNVGYATSLSSADSIIFGRRNINTIEHIVSGKYNFSSNSGFTIRVRHYVSDVNYKQFYLLNQDGTLGNTTYNANNNINYNLFNVDFIYSWWFAPGSEVSIAWKNAIQTNSNQLTTSYIKNLNNTINAPQQNSFSLKILYYIDYMKLRPHKNIL